MSAAPALLQQQSRKIGSLKDFAGIGKDVIAAFDGEMLSCFFSKKKIA